jgi:coenzyme F420 biosynthesis associated uncharacterized protein
VAWRPRIGACVGNCCESRFPRGGALNEASEQGRRLVSLDLAARTAARVATGPLDRSYLLEGLGADLDRLVSEAEPLVAEETGFTAVGPASARVLTRSEWARANIGSMLTLMAPLLQKIDERMMPGPIGELARAAYRPVLSLQLGVVLGFLSRRILGQYDLLVGGGNEVWFVGANIVETERRFGFIPRDFRLWVVLHELAHRAQFEGTPWLKDHFLGQVQEFFSSVRVDPRSMLEGVLDAIRNPNPDAPLAVLGPEQRERFWRLQALMTVIEGHGNFVMDRVARDRIPTQPRMRRTLEAHTALSGPLGRILRRLLGLDLKRRQYEEGQRFVAEVFAKGGEQAVRACFASPEALPSIEEIRAPKLWFQRVRA